MERFVHGDDVVFLSNYVDHLLTFITENCSNNLLPVVVITRMEYEVTIFFEVFNMCT